MTVRAPTPSKALAGSAKPGGGSRSPGAGFGAPAGSGPDVAGTDCPTGANDIDIKKELAQPFRTPERVAYLSNPEHGLEPIINNFGFRGPHAENIYENPTSLPDPGFKEVASSVAEGFDLAVRIADNLDERPDAHGTPE